MDILLNLISLKNGDRRFVNVTSFWVCTVCKHRLASNLCCHQRPTNLDFYGHLFFVWFFLCGHQRSKNLDFYGHLFCPNLSMLSSAFYKCRFLWPPMLSEYFYVVISVLPIRLDFYGHIFFRVFLCCHERSINIDFYGHLHISSE
jgi:hypothetical protein